MSTIGIVLVGGPANGQMFEREYETKEDGSTPIDFVYGNYQLKPVVAIRPAEVDHPEQHLRVEGIVFTRYRFDNWLQPGLVANFVPAT